MIKFVDQVAQYIKYQEIPLEDWTIVLPSERAKQYLQKALYEAYGKPILSPKIVTIYRWVQSLTPETVLDKARLMLRLFEIHTKHAKTEQDFSFDEFMKWGNILLSDFDEMDRYLISSKDLFRNLKDIKELENWSFGNETLSESQKRFMEFWDRLPGYYTDFNKLLESNDTIYMGKAYRKLQENLDVVFKENQKSHFLFAGFNALSPAETSIFKQLKNQGRGHILIDADQFYLDDKNHEAGAFLRDLMQACETKTLPFIQNSLATATKEIEIISCAQTTGQAKVVGTLLEAMDDEQLNETMVLLADESLIVPLLKNIPSKAKKANITLGLPLKNSSLRTWVEMIFRIQEGILKYNRVVAYHKDLINCWNHPFMIAIMTEKETQEVYQREKKMRKFNTVFQTPTKLDLSPKLQEIIDVLYTDWKGDWVLAMQSIRQLNQLIYKFLEKSEEFEKALIEGFDHAIIDFQNCIHEGIPAMALRTFKTLFNQQWMSDSMAYYGNPIEGLQIMGLLETRLLDFKTIIVLGMNEGKMPPTNPIQTIIPMDLRKYFKLPTPREKQGLFAHHFYRLLHQCETMYITYSTSSESLNSSEPSRYLMQLELELSRVNTNIKLTNKFYTIDSDESDSKITSIEKSPDVIERLDELFEGGTSASAIKTFINCPLDFYYKYVLKFGEEKKVEEEVESNTFGTFIHEVLEDLYQPFSRRDSVGELKMPQPPSLQPEDIDKMLKGFELLLRQKFSAHFNNDPKSFETGKNFLSFQMAKELLERFLKFEKKQLLSLNNKPFFIEALEQQFIHVLELEIAGKMRKIKLKGFADRIDSCDGHIRIVDYKTGKVDAKDVGGKMKAENEEDAVLVLFDTCIKSKHFFQLLVYNYLYFQKYQVVPANCSIISFVKLEDSPFDINLGELNMHTAVEVFPEVLRLILEEIYNEEIPFEHTTEYFNYCEYCV